MVKTEIKSLWKSKTFWLAVAQIVLGIITSLESQVASGVALSVLGVLFIVLRVLTSTAVTIFG